MKQTKKSSKLSLATQTVRALSTDEMNRVAGGTVYNWTTIAWTTILNTSSATQSGGGGSGGTSY
ncbi:MAG TPA: class I lanthipeptide [Kofleriaceae bacterium]|jgi:hypothetical protein|nr:class I lanthipeptide [Kofleriaceae bacterium]